MKILYVTTIGSTMSFFKTLIRELLDEGHTVDIATSETVKPVPACYREWGCRVFHLPCSRSPLSKGKIINSVGRQKAKSSSINKNGSA